MTERVNRTLKAQLAIYTERHPSLWDKEIPKLAFAIRISINETTGDTLAYLNFGRDPLIPLDLIIHHPVTGPPPTTPKHRYIRDYRTNLLHNLGVAYDFVREHSEIKKLAQKTQYDRNTSSRNFVVCDLVWVQLPSLQVQNNVIAHKLRPKYQGPCRLIDRISPSTFIVLRLSDQVNLGATNIDRMKLYYLPTQDTFSSSRIHTPPPSTSNRRFSIRTRRPPIRYQYIMLNNSMNL